jgi:antirestriction protein ArdC
MTGLEMENKIKDLLGSKITAGEMDFLHGFYRIPGIYRYSIRNTIMIMIQGGSIAMGFDRWQKAGRHVKRGEHANIEILVPKMITATDKVTGDKDQLCAGFFGRKVFDISQTEGKPLEYQNNSAEVINVSYADISVKLQSAMGINITSAITGSARGYFKRGITAGAREIVISSMSNNSDKCKTLFHELGHALLHESAEDVASHPAREVEAELTSLLVCSVLGVEFQESALYIKAYNDHKPEVRVLKVISAVQKILKAMEPAAGIAAA